MLSRYEDTKFSISDQQPAGSCSINMFDIFPRISYFCPKKTLRISTMGSRIPMKMLVRDRKVLRQHSHKISRQLSASEPIFKQTKNNVFSRVFSATFSEHVVENSLVCENCVLGTPRNSFQINFGTERWGFDDNIISQYLTLGIDHINIATHLE